MMEPMNVAMHAIRRAVPDFGTEGFTPDPTLRIVVIGLGTIGLLLTSLLCGAGYQQILVSGKKSFQRKLAQRLGVPEKNIYAAASDMQQGPISFSSAQDSAQQSTTDGDASGNIGGGDSDCSVNDKDNGLKRWVFNRTDGQGADIVFECVGRNETAVQAINAAAPQGRVIFVGNPAGNMQFPRDVYWKILRNQLTVTGTWNSSFTGEENDDWHCVRRLLAESRVKPEELITQRFPMGELEKGLWIMRDKTEEYVKVMVFNPTSEIGRLSNEKEIGCLGNSLILVKSF